MTPPLAYFEEPPTPARQAIAHNLQLRPRSSKAETLRPFCRTSGLEDDLRTLADSLGVIGGHYVHIGHAVRNPSVDHRNRPARFVATSISDRRLYLDEHGLAADPTYPRAVDAKTPFAWSITAEEWTEEPSDWLARRLRARGIQGGVIAPIQDYAAGPAYLCLYSAFAGDAGQIVATRMSQLVSSAASFHDCAKARIGCAKSGAAENLLTPREMECLRLAALGHTVSETANALQVTPRTVEFHLKNVTDKFEAPNKLRAVALAVSRGLIAI